MHTNPKNHVLLEGKLGNVFCIALSTSSMGFLVDLNNLSMEKFIVLSTITWVFCALSHTHKAMSLYLEQQQKLMLFVFRTTLVSPAINNDYCDFLNISQTKNIKSLCVHVNTVTFKKIFVTRIKKRREKKMIL